MLNIKIDINFSRQQKINMEVNANSLQYTTIGNTITIQQICRYNLLTLHYEKKNLKCKAKNLTCIENFINPLKNVQVIDNM